MTSTGTRRGRVRARSPGGELSASQFLCKDEGPNADFDLKSKCTKLSEAQLENNVIFKDCHPSRKEFRGVN